jgi:hypothetical protein
VIDQALASKLLIPLWQLFPKTDEAPDYQDLITRTLAKASDDEAHGSVTVERLITTCRFKPLPVEVMEASIACATAHAEQPPEQEWAPQRQPGDEPFNGLADLVDDRLLEILRRKVEQGRTHVERESARQLLLMREKRERASA